MARTGPVPEFPAVDVLHNLCHDVRGHLSRLRLQIELSPMAAASADLAFAQIDQVDDAMRAHLDLVRVRPTREASVHPLGELVSRALLVVAESAGWELDESLSLAVAVWPEFVVGIVRALARHAIAVGKPPFSVRAYADDEKWCLEVIGAGSVVDPATLRVGSDEGIPVGPVNVLAACRLAAMMDAEIVSAPAAAGFSIGLACAKR